MSFNIGKSMEIRRKKEYERKRRREIDHFHEWLCEFHKQICRTFIKRIGNEYGKDNIDEIIMTITENEEEHEKMWKKLMIEEKYKKKYKEAHRDYIIEQKIKKEYPTKKEDYARKSLEEYNKEKNQRLEEKEFYKNKRLEKEMVELNETIRQEKKNELFLNILNESKIISPKYKEKEGRLRSIANGIEETLYEEYGGYSPRKYLNRLQQIIKTIGIWLEPLYDVEISFYDVVNQEELTEKFHEQKKIKVMPITSPSLKRSEAFICHLENLIGRFALL